MDTFVCESWQRSRTAARWQHQHFLAIRWLPAASYQHPVYEENPSSGNFHVLWFQKWWILYTQQNCNSSWKQFARFEISAVFGDEGAVWMVYCAFTNQTTKQHGKELYLYHEHSNRSSTEPTFRKRHSHASNQNLRPPRENQSRLRLPRLQSSRDNPIFFSEVSLLRVIRPKTIYYFLLMRL